MNYLVLKSFCQIFLVLLSVALTFQQDSWNYDNPRYWYRQYPTCRTGGQAPLDITNPKKVNLNPIFFGLYDESFNENSIMENNGHTIEFQIPSTPKGRPYITDGPLFQEKYEAVSAHFHWGRRTGSEHIINGRPLDLELNIVHDNGRGEQAVLVILCEVTKPPPPVFGEISRKLHDVYQFRSKAVIENFTTLNSILGNVNREIFYTYKGSSTTPPCKENVRYIIFPDTIGVDPNMVLKFLQVKDFRNYNLESNIRPIQAQNEREIQYINPN